MNEPARTQLPPPRSSGTPNRNRAQEAFEMLRGQLHNPKFRQSVANAIPLEQRTTGYVDRLCEAVFVAVRDNNELLSCDRASLFRAVERVAKSGLPIGAGGFHLVPYKGQVQEQLDYRGALTLVRRSKMVRKISAHVIRDNDFCVINLGTDEGIVHRPALTNRGEWLGVYAVATIDGVETPEIEFMERSEIEKVRELAPSKNSPAWRNFADEMARKIVLKRLAKRLPLEDPDALRDMDDRGGRTIDGRAETIGEEIPLGPAPVVRELPPERPEPQQALPPRQEEPVQAPAPKPPAEPVKEPAQAPKEEPPPIRPPQR